MSLPIKSCCASGSLHTGEPQGKIIEHHGRQTYVAEAPDGKPKGIVVIVPDAFGIGLLNNRILADEYAKKGNFTVVRAMIEWKTKTSDQTSICLTS